MNDDAPFPTDPEDTRVEILKATHTALREHGYANLTIDRIGQYFPKSKSLLYHHYEGKDDMLVDLLAYLLGTFEAGMGLDEAADADERLRSLLDRALSPTADSEAEAMRDAMVELRAQGANDEEYRQHFTEHDRFFKEQLAEIVRDGVEAGTFQAVDPEQVAAMLHTLVGGSMVHRATTNSEDTAAVRAEAEAYLEHRLLADGR